MQINDIPQNENVPPPPIDNSRPIFNEARLPYRKESITGAFKTENHEHYLGPMNYEYIDCGAFKFLLDEGSLCCNRWKIAFPRVTWPDRYRELFVTRDEYSKDFLKNLRMYNSAFLMVFCKLHPELITTESRRCCRWKVFPLLCLNYANICKISANGAR